MSKQDMKPIDCLHENEVKKLKGKIELLEDKVRTLSINQAIYYADYEGKIAELRGGRIHSELEYYKQACRYLNDQNRALTKSMEKTSKYIKSSVRLLKAEQSKYKEFLERSKLGASQAPLPLDTDQAIDFLNILDAKLTDSDDLHTNKDLEQKLKEELSTSEGANTKGIRRLIKPRYNIDLLLEELHKLIDGRKPREHVPYILILWDKQVFDRLPTWTEMRDEFNDIGAPSKSNYCKFLNYNLEPIENTWHFPEKEVASKRSTIKDILEKCENSIYRDFPF